MPEHGDITRCDLLVFDLDGTLIDSERDLANAVNATLGFLGRGQLPPSAIADFVGDGAALLLRRAMEATGTFEDAQLTQALPFFFDFYRAHNLDFTCCYPGVIAALEGIREANPVLPMAILTNKPHRPSRAICSGLGLTKFFFANYGGDSFPTRKPEPEGMHTLMLEASKLLGRTVTPARTVLVGDSHVDVETARNAGTKVIGCLYGLAPEKLRAAAPDMVIDHPSTWIEAISTVLQSERR